MAKSFKTVIESVLEEISLCGDQGASPVEVLSFIDTVYATPSQEHEIETGPLRTPKVDHALKSKLWTWLTRHPDVSVGKNREGNGLSLDEVLVKKPEPTALPKNVDPSLVAEETGPKEDYRHELRVYVSQERMWRAITGHGPDKLRVFPLEFALLSIIASQKSRGIVQGDLVQLSGQDKRSVPKRTDSLQSKGYIEKKAIQYKGSRTSLCILRKFANSTPAEISQAVRPENERVGIPKADEMIDFGVLLDKLFQCLREKKVITRHDLKNHLGMTELWRSMVLRRAIRKLEAIGCVRRVKAISQYYDVMQSSHASVMLVREPTEKDIRLFHEDSTAVIASLQQEGSDDMEDAQSPAQDEDEDEEMDIIPRSDIVEMSDGQQNILQYAGRKIPQWTPDKSLPHLIFNLVDQAGPRGMDNREIAAASMGSFFRRPIETVLARLVDSWQYTQPLHLRHLSLIRDTALRGTVSYFVQYSFQNFAALVKEGKASWEAVETPIKKKAGPPPPVDATPNLDEYGFVIGDEPAKLLKQGNATLRECLEVAKPSDYIATFRDPVAVLLRDGTYGVRFGDQLLTPHEEGRSQQIDANSAGWNQSGIKRNAFDAGLLDVSESLENTPQPRQVKRRKKKDAPEKLSELEQLKAKGYDESWILYSALVLEKPTPGLYLTPIGKRRANGMRQGRARKGRIAIFKLPRLKELSWFVKSEQESLPERSGAPAEETQTPSPQRPRTRRARKASVYDSVDRTQSRAVSTTRDTTVESGLDAEPETTSFESDRMDEDATSKRSSRKRKQPEPDETVESGSEKTTAAPVRARRGRPPKKSRLTNQSQSRQRQTAVEVSIVRKPVDKVGSAEDRKRPSQRGKTDEMVSKDIATTEQVGDHDLVRRISATEAEQRQQSTNGVDLTDTNRPGVLQQPGDHEDRFEDVTMESEAPADTIEHDLPHELKPPGFGINGQPVGEDDSQTPLEALKEVQEYPTPTSAVRTEPESRSTKKAKKDTIAGSIAFLRRKIVMDVIEQCGGAHTLGTELWYPFATAWMKAKPEKPDMRTIKGAVRALVDAGKLRQITFSGKNSKGLMVTKSLVAKPEIDLTDPMIRDLQSAVLAADPHLYLHPKAEIDPTLRKSDKGLAGHPLKLPAVEEQVHVTLNYVPAQIRPRPPKPPRTHRYPFIRDRRSFDLGSHDFQTAERQPKVRRLKSLQKRPSTSPFLDSLSAPLAHGPAFASLQSPPSRESYAGLLFGARWRPSLLSMLMSPPQTFNVTTRTFGTAICYTPKPSRSSRKVTIAPKPVPLPEKLEDILSVSRRRNVDFSSAPDPASMSFFSDVDTVRNWETRYEFPAGPPDSKLRYIDHTIPGAFESVPLEGPIRFEMDQPPPPHSRRTELAVTRQATFRAMGYPWPDSNFSDTTPRSASGGHYVRRPPQKKDLQNNRRLAQLQESTKVLQGTSKPADRIFRRVRYSKDFPQRVAQRLTMAIVVVRTLAGGLEGKLIDWSLVLSVFPEYDAKFMQDRGKSILSRHRLQMAKMQRDFQERYLEAYENDLVPAIDYNDLEGYDWGAVVTWAEEQLERPSLRKVPSLPATHQQFDSIFDIRKEPMLDIDELYQHNAQTTIPRKRTLYANLPFAVPVVQQSTQTVGTLSNVRKAEEAERLQVAKTWVRANVVTPEETYRPADARQILERLGEDLIGQAILSLITERVISMSNRGKVAPGRNYDITEHFLHAFGRKRSIEAVQLRRAKHFKLSVLDPAIRSAGKYELAYDAEDGDILVLINLVAEGRVTVWPINPPRNKYGLTERGYLTRLMDKAKLRFDVEIRPVEEQYVYGDPLAEAVEKTPIPNAGIDDSVLKTLTTLPRVPLWIDVHGNFVKVLWELVVAAVLGLVATRPGSGADVIGRIIQPFVGAWEVELVLQWLGNVGAIRRVREDNDVDNKACGGWTVREWWYLVLSS